MFSLFFATPLRLMPLFFSLHAYFRRAHIRDDIDTYHFSRFDALFRRLLSLFSLLRALRQLLLLRLYFHCR